MPSIPFPKKKVPRSVALEQLAILEATYPHPVTALEYDSDFELLIAVILSAQCTDARVDMARARRSSPSIHAPEAGSRASRRRRDDHQVVAVSSA